MKGFWESVSTSTLSIVRAISYAIAFFMLFATAYLSGFYSHASMWTAVGMFFTAGVGSMCNAGIAAQKLFRSAIPHLVMLILCWGAAFYIALIA